MKIGELARKTSSSPENIRFYEKEGLLPAPERSNNNYRRYTQIHVERLHLIRSYRALDISLNDMRSLLAWERGDAAEPELMEQAVREHLSNVEARIEQLTRLKEHLLELTRHARNAVREGTRGNTKSHV